MNADLSMDDLERLLLLQQRRGHNQLRFTSRLEQLFRRDRFRFMQRHWGTQLVVLAAVSFQFFYAIHDLLVMPLQVNFYLLPLRVLSILVIIASWLYFRRPQADPTLAQRFFTSSYVTCGVLVVMLIYASHFQGAEMPYEGLLLFLVFGYGVLNLPFRSVMISGWVLYGLFLVLGLALSVDSERLAYQLLFLGCVILIGSTGSYLQEHAHRSGWINQRLLNIARRRSEAENQVKLRQLAAVSHDLRQPLNALGLYAQHLRECAEDAEVRRISEQLNASVEQLGRMLQSLLDYNRLTLTGSVQTQPTSINLSAMLNRLCHEAQADAGNATALRVECPPGLWVRSDQALLERMIRNLLTNALKHAQAAHIWLRAEPQEGTVLLEVGDDGVGLNAEQQEQVFEEFQQLSNPGRNVEQGLGLGLAIVRQLARLLGHRLQLISAPGEGSRFQLQLPPAEAISETVQPVLPAVLGRILLIEDDRASREALTALLTRWGCEVQACFDAEEAQARLESADPELLVSDYRLGGELDGLQLIARLRERSGRMLPALLISADVSPQLQERCVRENVQLLGKPLLPARLRQAVGRFLSAAPASEPAPLASGGDAGGA